MNMHGNTCEYETQFLCQDQRNEPMLLFQIFLSAPSSLIWIRDTGRDCFPKPRVQSDWFCWSVVRVSWRKDSTAVHPPHIRFHTTVDCVAVRGVLAPNWKILRRTQSRRRLFAAPDHRNSLNCCPTIARFDGSFQHWWPRQSTVLVYELYHWNRRCQFSHLSGGWSHLIPPRQSAHHFFAHCRWNRYCQLSSLFHGWCHFHPPSMQQHPTSWS